MYRAVAHDTGIIFEAESLQTIYYAVMHDMRWDLKYHGTSSLYTFHRYVDGTYASPFYRIEGKTR